jgi:hypothetical protein
MDLFQHGRHLVDLIFKPIGLGAVAKSALSSETGEPVARLQDRLMDNLLIDHSQDEIETVCVDCELTPQSRQVTVLGCPSNFFPVIPKPPAPPRF